MGGLHQKPMPPRYVRRFSHAGKPYIAYEGGVPAFKPGTLVATGYAVSVVADGHHTTPALEAVEAKRSTEEARGGCMTTALPRVRPLVLKRRAQAFDNPDWEARGRDLMAAVEEHDLEGIVAKRKADPYRRGVHWWKIKNPAYSQAEGRYELFNGGERRKLGPELTE